MCTTSLIDKVLENRRVAAKYHVCFRYNYDGKPVSAIEAELASVLKKQLPHEVILHCVASLLTLSLFKVIQTSQMVGGFELDIFLPAHRLNIEV